MSKFGSSFTAHAHVTWITGARVGADVVGAERIDVTVVCALGALVLIRAREPIAYPT